MADQSPLTSKFVGISKLRSISTRVGLNIGPIYLSFFPLLSLLGRKGERWFFIFTSVGATEKIGAESNTCPPAERVPRLLNFSFFPTFASLKWMASQSHYWGKRAGMKNSSVEAGRTECWYRDNDGLISILISYRHAKRGCEWCILPQQSQIFFEHESETKLSR